MKSNRQRTVKCVVVGDDSVGKTSMLLAYATSRFPGQYVPTTFDNYAGELCVSGQTYSLQLLDTIEHQKPSIRVSEYADADIFVVCFSVVQPASFKNVQEKWVPDIKMFAPEKPFIILGTQTDLREAELVVDTLRAESQTPVTTKESAALAKWLGAACYIESSPCTEKRLRSAINGALVSVLKTKPREAQSCIIL